ncbi:uncharacterized protein FOMMEDRAFT_170579 [Fomitiporia mediterranea MF3/22]|uniref:uncharacterized protein n=1 Tax=Fomitiporia mediterranea (strain MF3/22) TaxID=694068 RepID=UPI0004408BCA|nr:uncharacterized protein FOMMEDRAFT_170579 [Fomitiporia mediterranea MF3/22]EJC99262.1 hypothetical protein FOMMEDRAFT_170579 [Fomitiporia mediterranea MF3/22]
MSQAVELTTHDESASNVPVIENVKGEKTKPEPEPLNDVLASPASEQANGGINGAVVDEEHVEKASKAEPAAALTEQVVSSPVQETVQPEQGVPVKDEKELNGNALPDAGQANGDAKGHVKLPESDTVPAKPVDEKDDCVKKPARRTSSALSSIVEKTKSTVMFLPRGRTSRRTATPHGGGHHQSSNGGCTIF